MAEKNTYELTYIILANYTIFLRWNKLSFPKTKENAVELARGGGINYFFIHTTTWGIIKCEESGLENVKKNPNSIWMVKDNWNKIKSYNFINCFINIALYLHIWTSSDLASFPFPVSCHCSPERADLHHPLHFFPWGTCSLQWGHTQPFPFQAESNKLLVFPVCNETKTIWTVQPNNMKSESKHNCSL